MLDIQIDWLGLALPLAYLVVLVGALMTFSSIYRKRKAAQSANLKPWFGPHLQRNMYFSLLQLDPENRDEKTAKVPSYVLKAALLRRAVEDISRLMQVRTAKSALSSLLQKGFVGDDLWQRFQRAEKEMESELRDVVMEANALAPGWGQSIFQSANEMTLHEKLRKQVGDIQGTVDTEKEWWDKRRATIEAEFMKELEEDATPKPATKKTAKEEEPAVVDKGAPAPSAPAANSPVDSPAGKKKKGRK